MNIYYLLSFLIKIVTFYDHITEYIVQRQPLGGLLFLLPQMFNFDNRDGMGIYHQNHGKELLRNVMVELEQLLIHANIPVSGINSPYLNMGSPLLLFISCISH